MLHRAILWCTIIMLFSYWFLLLTLCYSKVSTFKYHKRQYIRVPCDAPPDSGSVDSSFHSHTFTWPDGSPGIMKWCTYPDLDREKFCPVSSLVKNFDPEYPLAKCRYYPKDSSVTEYCEGRWGDTHIHMYTCTDCIARIYIELCSAMGYAP